MLLILFAEAPCLLAPFSWNGLSNSFIFLYFGPETILPVASVLASIIGVLLMFWRYLVVRIRKLFKRTPVDESTEKGATVSSDAESQHLGPTP